MIDSSLLLSCKHEPKITKQQAVCRTAYSNSLMLATTQRAKQLEHGPNRLLVTCASSLKCGSTEGIFMTYIQVGSYIGPQISLPVSNTTFLLKIIDKSIQKTKEYFSVTKQEPFVQPLSLTKAWNSLP